MRPAGDREMVEILPLVLRHDEQMVLAAVELAFEAGAPNKQTVLNILSRLLDSPPVLPLQTPQAFTLTVEPQASRTPLAASTNFNSFTRALDSLPQPHRPR